MISYHLFSRVLCTSILQTRTLQTRRSQSGSGDIKMIWQIVQTAVMSVVIVSIYSGVRYVFIVTDRDEPLCRRYRVCSVAVVLIFSTLAGVFLT